MPEPINFFDSDCDDSVFVPLDDSPTQAAEQNTCVDTDEVEVLPADTGFSHECRSAAERGRKMCHSVRPVCVLVACR